MKLLTISDLSVTVSGKTVLNGINMEIGNGEVVALLGANGSGKSSLANVLMGNNAYEISGGRIEFVGENIGAITVDERVRRGLYVAWQSPLSIPGVSVFNLAKASYESTGKTIEKLTEFKTKLEELAKRVGLGNEHVSRSVNEGFSGGERKRLEILQLLLLQPKLAVLDEIDSGLDSAGVLMVTKVINEMREKGTSFILITHNKKILEKVKIDQTLEISDGKLSARV